MCDVRYDVILVYASSNETLYDEQWKVRHHFVNGLQTSFVGCHVKTLNKTSAESYADQKWNKLFELYFVFVLSVL